MPVYTRRQFDKLSDEQKRESFTVTALRSNEKSLGRVQKLRDLIAETIHITDETEAWAAYYEKSKQFLRKEEQTEATKQGLFTSFRYARQTAYNRAIDGMIASGQSDIIAIRLETQDDAKVRPTHKRWDGVTLRADHPIWKEVQLPWDFGCRCFKLPIMIGTQVQLTPDDKIPPIPKGF